MKRKLFGDSNYMWSLMVFEAEEAGPKTKANEAMTPKNTVDV